MGKWKQKAMTETDPFVCSQVVLTDPAKLCKQPGVFRPPPNPFLFVRGEVCNDNITHRYDTLTKHTHGMNGAPRERQKSIALGVTKQTIGGFWVDEIHCARKKKINGSKAGQTQ